VLRVDVHEVRPNLTQSLQRHRCVVDKSPRLARRADFTPQNALRIIVQVFRLKNILKLVVFDIELPFNHALALGVEEHSRVGPVAEQQPNGAEHNRLARPRFTGNNIEQRRWPQL
jgi:hypothetical protein